MVTIGVAVNANGALLEEMNNTTGTVVNANVAAKKITIGMVANASDADKKTGGQ